MVVVDDLPKFCSRVRMMFSVMWISNADSISSDQASRVPISTGGQSQRQPSYPSMLLLGVSPRNLDFSHSEVHLSMSLPPSEVRYSTLKATEFLCLPLPRVLRNRAELFGILWGEPCRSAVYGVLTGAKGKFPNMWLPPVIIDFHVEVSTNGGPKNGWFTMENPI